MSSPSDKVWIFVEGRRSFKWKGSDLCPFHKSRLSLLSKGRCQKLRWPNPFWSVAYCKKTVKLTQWTVAFPVQHPPPSSLLTLLLWHLGKHLEGGLAPSPTQSPQSCLPAGQKKIFLGGLHVEKAPAVSQTSQPCIVLLRRALHGTPLWRLCSDPLRPPGPLSLPSLLFNLQSNVGTPHLSSKSPFLILNSHNFYHCQLWTLANTMDDGWGSTVASNQCLLTPGAIRPSPGGRCDLPHARCVLPNPTPRWLKGGNDPHVSRLMNIQTKGGTSIQWNITQSWKRVR